MQSYLVMGYDGVGVSSMDLSLGIDFFQQTKNDGFPWLSANVYDTKSRQFFTPHLIKKRSGLTLGIIGITGRNRNVPEPFKIGDWEKPLAQEIQLLEKQCDMLILLSTLNNNENNQALTKFPQLDIIVSSDHQGRNTPPKVRSNTLLLQGGYRGKHLGKLDVSFQSPGPWLTTSSHSKAQLQKRLRVINNRIGALLRQQKSTGKNKSELIAQLSEDRHTLIKKLATIDRPANTNSMNREELQGKSYISTFLSVQPHHSANQKEPVDRIVSQINTSIKSFNRYRHSKMQRDKTALDRMLQKDIMAGTSVCNECHDKQTAFWKSTAHADAYLTLERRGQAFNLQCLPCHVTGGNISSSTNEEDKLHLLMLPSNRQTIGCEVCHGPARKHSEIPEQLIPISYPGEEICLQCHTPDHDDNFSYKEKLALISCPAN